MYAVAKLMCQRADIAQLVCVVKKNISGVSFKIVGAEGAVALALAGENIYLALVTKLGKNFSELTIETGKYSVNQANRIIIRIMLLYFAITNTALVVAKFG